jgi:hypothetical protein
MNNFETIIKEKSNSELSDIYIKNRGYQEEFMKLVEVELTNRNVPVDSLLKFREEQAIIDDSKLQLGEQGSQFWITAAFIGAILGGIWAIFAGYSYAYSKHKSKNGKEYFVYNESTRKYGRIMLTVGCIIFGLAFLLSSII